MTEPRKRCLYEVLGLSRDCSQDEIRSAYRRLALQLHPDKLAQSAGISASAATAAFQELLHAYEVLSDPKERAWYDSHRSQILFSDPSLTSKSHKPSSFFDLDLFSFFSNSAFSGYTDTGKGFYKVYGDLFAKIYAQELWFVKELGLASDSVLPAPLIGNLECQYSQVTAFYNYWLGFCTVMDFGWMDEYDASIGPNRRSRRVMEEENKKARKKARREYNDTVRGLAAFVKKRDKRVRDMQLKKSLEEEKRRADEKARKKEEERKKMERAQMYEEPDWAKIDHEVEEMILKGGFNELDDAKKKKEKGSEEFYCVVCSKKFKSDKQWKNHEQSKKHRDKVAELKFSFQEEAEEVMEDGDDIEKFNVGFDYKPVESEDSVVDELCEEVTDDLRLKEEGIEGGDLEEIDKKLDSDDDEATILEAMVSGRMNRKNEYLAGEVFHHDDDEEKSSMGYDTSRTRSTAARRGIVGEDDDEAVREEASAAGKDDSEVQNQEVNAEELKEDASCNSEEATARSKGDQVVGKNRKLRKQQVEKEPAKKETVVSRNSSKGRKNKGTWKASGNSCETCGESFDTRNKLFAHLGDTGHAMLKSR